MLFVRKRVGHSFQNKLLNIIIIFGFVFEMPILNIITTRRISCLYIILSLLRKNIRNNKALLRLKVTVDYELLLSVLGLFICFIICVLNDVVYVHHLENIYFKPHYFVYIFLYIIVFAFWCKEVFADAVEFSKVYMPIMLLQSFVVLIGAISKPFRLLIYNLFYFGDERFETTIQIGTRVGGISLYGATGSMIMCTACILLIYLMINNQIKAQKFYVFYTIITGATAFVGRTGFYIELGLIVLYAIMSNNIKNVVLTSISLALSLVIIELILSVLNPNVSKSIKNWIGEIFHKETRFNTISALLNMKVPPISGEMIFGTNVTVGITPGGAIMGSDSGYARTYCAIGIVGAIIYYSSFCCLFSYGMSKVSGIRNKHYFLFVVLISFIIEIKEPFFRQYIVAWMTLTLMLLPQSTKIVPEEEV